MKAYTIQVEYLGVIRLLLRRKEDIFAFNTQPTREMLITAIAGRHGAAIGEECRRHLFMVYTKEDPAGFIAGDNDLLSDEAVIRIVSMVTGG